MLMKGRMKKILVVSLLLNLVLVVTGAVFYQKGYHRKLLRPYLRDYYHYKVDHYASLPRDGARIFFVGDSLTDRCEWAELFGRCDIASRGIDGDTTDGVLNRIGEVTVRKPAKIFLMIGGNDFVIRRSVRTVAENYEKIIARIRAESPETIIYIQSNLPTLYRLFPLPRHLIRELNQRLRTMADNRKIFFLDIYSRMADENGDLKEEYTIDGAHLTARGYMAWRDAIREYVGQPRK